MKLLDTSVAIDHLRGTPPAVGLLSRLIEAEESLLASEVVSFELLAGVREKEVDALEQFFLSDLLGASRRGGCDEKLAARSMTQPDRGGRAI